MAEEVIRVGQAASLRRVVNPPLRRLATGAQLTKLPYIATASGASHG
jgi:hypothetical protein